MRTLRLKNVIYFPWLNVVGGVETFCYQMGLKYGKTYDITVVYQGGDDSIIDKIAETCRVVRFRDGDEIECDVFIFGWGYDILDHVKAKEYIQTFHADYINRHLNPCPDKRVTKRFGVAENTTKGIREHFDWAKDIVTMYNPYTVPKPRKVLNLVSATRLTAEKGFARMVRLAEALDEAKIPFHWIVFTDKPQDFPNKSVVVLPARHDVVDFIANSDYLVQLSDTEGYSYSVVEALSVGTPVICTAFAVAEEQGIVNGKTGFILPMDMKEIPIDAIYKGVKKFTYVPNESHYETVLVKGKAKIDEDYNKPVRIRCKRTYHDIELNAVQNPGDEHEVSMRRAEKLLDMGLVEIV